MAQSVRGWGRGGSSDLLQSGPGFSSRRSARLDLDRPHAHEQRRTHRPAIVQRGHISQTIVNTVNAAPGFTSIVPFDLNGDGLTDLLSYNAATGLGFYSIATGLGVQKVEGQAAQGATGWTSIVPVSYTHL